MYSNSATISKLIDLDIFTLLGTTQLEQFAAMVIIWLLLIFSFFISGHICARTWDDWTDLKKAATRLRMSKVKRQNLRGYLLTISNIIADEDNGTLQR
jgi:hypothetical protein